MDDLKVSLRQLAKSPAFTLAAIVVLALGIGLNAAMFSAVHALTIAARPFPEPERLVQLYSRDARTKPLGGASPRAGGASPPRRACDHADSSCFGAGDEIAWSSGAWTSASGS